MPALAAARKTCVMQCGLSTHPTATLLVSWPAVAETHAAKRQDLDHQVNVVFMPTVCGSRTHFAAYAVGHVV